MFDFLFFIKTLLASLLVVAFLQIKIGETTMEEHATDWIRTSVLTMPLQGVAAGGVQIIRDSTRWVSRQVQTKTKSLFGAKPESPGERVQSLKVERSEKYRERSEAQQTAIQKLTNETKAER